MKAQTRQALENVRLVLEAGGATLDDVVKVTVFVSNLEEHYSDFQEARSEYFKEDFPASTLVGVKALASEDFLVEVEAIAVTR